MKCSDVLDKLGFFLDGDIPGEERLEISSHLEQCQHCKNEYMEMVNLIDCLKESPGVKPPVDFTSQVMSQISGSRKKHGIEWRDFIFTPRVLQWNVAVAVSLVIMVGAALFLYPRNNYMHQVETINVRFELNLPADQGIKTVSLAGDFNGWDIKNTPLQSSKNGSWVVEVPLEKGRYQYMFVVNGERWVQDPKAQKLINDGFGGKNSLLEI